MLLLRIVDLVVGVVDPPSERLALQGIVLVQRQNMVAVEEAFWGPSANEESNVWRSVTVQLS